MCILRIFEDTFSFAQPNMLLSKVCLLTYKSLQIIYVQYEMDVNMFGRNLASIYAAFFSCIFLPIIKINTVDSRYFDLAYLE